MKEGTVGPPLPGIAVKVVDFDTGEDLGPNRSGMLLVKGPNVMKGYYGQPNLPPKSSATRAGRGDIPRKQRGTVPFPRWYITGDVAEIDREGFIKITGGSAAFRSWRRDGPAHPRRGGHRRGAPAR